MIEKFAENTIVLNPKRASDEDPLVKVSLKLENILSEGVEPTDEKNIFFVDSSRVLKNPPKTMSPRQLCSYESAARSNPDMKIYVVFISPRRSMNLDMTKALNSLLSYDNINIVMLKLTPFSKNTPAKEFIASGKLKTSRHPIEHASDVFRLLLLWKYGGYYLDSDFIVRKSLKQLGSNFGCADGEPGIITNALLNFDRKKGHELLEVFINDQLTNFNGESWGYNGPESFTRVANEICDGLELKHIKKVKECGVFRIQPRKLCFPILASKYERMFMRNYTKALMKRTKNAVTVHMWNQLTKDIKTKKTEKNLYTQLAKSFCPKIFKAIDSEF